MEGCDMNGWWYVIAWWVIVLGSGFMLGLGVEYDNGSYIALAIIGFCIGLVVSILDMRYRFK